VTPERGGAPAAHFEGRAIIKVLKTQKNLSKRRSV